MKKQLKWILPVIGLVVLLLAAGAVYRNLSGKYAPQAPTVSSSQAQSDAPSGSEPLPDETQPQNVPAFTVQNAEGKDVRLSDLRGKPVVLNFWATWCPYCIQELPAFDELAAEYGDRIEFMMIDLVDGMRETMDAGAAYIAENGYSFPVYYDLYGEAADAFSINPVPVTVFLHPDGTVMDTHIGAMDAGMLRSYLDALIA